VNPGNRKGILAIVVAMTLFAGSDALLKLAMGSVPAGQLLFVRGFVLIAIFGAVAWRAGAFARPGALVETNSVVRGVLEGIGALAFVAALAHVPLALNAAINMATPLMALPIAAFVLGERFGWRRVMAILVGFAGVLLILRPSAEGVDFWLLISFLSAVMCAVRDVFTRRIPANFPSASVTLTTVVCVCAVGGAATFVEGWAAMDARAWTAIFVSAGISGVGQHLMVLSMRWGEVAVVSPFRYSGIFASTFVGWAVWGDLPDALAWAGIVLIVGAGLYALWRERMVKG
jgi:drug/metabolite transporter (DMT)-like permease